jgi:hypothetical protein
MDELGSKMEGGFAESIQVTATCSWEIEQSEGFHVSTTGCASESLLFWV